MYRFAFRFALLICIAFSGYAEDAPMLRGAEAEKAKEATIDFQGSGFGSGLAIVADWGKRRRVAEAEVVNNIVRIKKDNSTTPRILLNLHYFFSEDCTDNPNPQWCQPVEGGKPIPMRGWGPFFAVQPGSDQTISAVGAGFMYGWRRRADKSDSFNIGLGILMDQNVKTLGDGITANQPLPQGETQIRFKESSGWGAVLMASWAF